MDGKVLYFTQFSRFVFYFHRIKDSEAKTILFRKYDRRQNSVKLKELFFYSDTDNSRLECLLQSKEKAEIQNKEMWATAEQNAQAFHLQK